MGQLVSINIITGNEPANTISQLLVKQISNQRQEAQQVGSYFNALSAGDRMGSFDVQVNGGASVAATGTVTFSSFSTAADTILINGVTLTAVASGAVNNQWNVKGTSALQAVEVARAINASTTALVSGSVIASVVGSVVTLTAASLVGGVITIYKGILGNAISIAKGTDAGTVMTVSGARLIGGVATAANVYHFGV